jgi:uncharacterized membrane protein
MSEPPEPPDPQHMLLERMLFFSDAVFAIVLTLLALELRMPPGIDDAHLLHGLVEMRGELIAFSVSFAIVGIFWLAHLSMMRALARFDWLLAIVNLVFLFTVAFTPFVTTLVGADGNTGNAWRLYCLSIIAISVMQCMLLLLSHRDEERLVHADHHGRLTYRLLRAGAPGIAFATGFFLSLEDWRLAASLCWVLVPLIMLSARWLEPQPRPAAALSTPTSEG